LNLFHIHGQDYGAYHDGGTSFSTRPDEVRLSDCGFRINERFRYEYDFGDRWQHNVHVEARLALDAKRHLSALHWRQSAGTAGRRFY
jgi:hypothetical protein